MATYTNMELQHITTEPLAPPPTPVETSLESTPPQHIFINTRPPVHAEYVPMDWGTRITDPTPPGHGPSSDTTSVSHASTDY